MPWRIVPLLLGSPQKAAPGPVSALCSSVTSEGQTQHLCHAFGYTMPSFIFWASLLILALFVVSSAMLLLQCRTLGKALQRVSTRIEQLGLKADQKLSATELRAISAILREEPTVRRAWARFEETLLVPGGDGEVLATSSLEEFFGRAQFVEQHVDTAYFGAVPGVLTGVGLLMTFVAILDGLSHVSVSASMDVTGIGGLINGLSGKFVSSVTAVSCAVLFVFVERIAFSRLYAAHDALISTLRGRFKRRTTEQMLLQIQSQLAELLAKRGT